MNDTPTCRTCKHARPGMPTYAWSDRGGSEYTAWRDFPEWHTCFHPLMRENHISPAYRFMPLDAYCGLHESGDPPTAAEVAERYPEPPPATSLRDRLRRFMRVKID
jgi:hypothetical protein